MKKVINRKIIILLSLLLFLTLFSGCFLFPPTNQAPTITSTQITTATVDELYTYDVDATDLDGDTLTYSLTTNPSGMTIDSTTGVISWTPNSDQIGNNNVTVAVSDGSLSDTQSFIIVVSEEEEPGWTPTPAPPAPPAPPSYGTAKGFVKDAVTKTGIEGATVIIGGKSSITEPNGAYFIENIPVGSQSIVVTALGYQDYNSTIAIAIEEGDNIIEDILLESEATHLEGSTGSDGVATFVLEDGRVVQVKVIDVVTGEPIPNIDSYLVTDGTAVAFLFIDPTGNYLPRIAPEEQNLQTLARPPEGRFIGTIKELWKMGEAQFNGYQPQYADQIESPLLSYMFRTFFIFCRPSTLGELKFNLGEFLIEFFVGGAVGAEIGAIIPVVREVLVVLGVVEVGNTAAYELWVILYTSRGYSLGQNFEIWRLDPIFAGVASVIPWVLPIEEPSGSVIEENPGSISGKVLDALGEGIYNAQVQIVDLNLSTTTSSDGSYRFSNVPPGTYGIVATKAGYNPSAQVNVRVFSEQETTAPSIVLSSILASTERRIILTWGAIPPDIDSHLTGPLPDGTRFHMYYPDAEANYGSPWPEYVKLDRDDVDSYGPETTTIYQQIPGVYRFSVHDYTNRGSSYSTALSNSGAQVRVYRGNGLIATTFDVPANQEGTLWTVFKMDGDTIIPINTMSYESSPSVVRRSSTPDAELMKNLPPKR